MFSAWRSYFKYSDTGKSSPITRLTLVVKPTPNTGDIVHSFAALVALRLRQNLNSSSTTGEPHLGESVALGTLYTT